MRVVVTGGAGFIGSHVTAGLAGTAGVDEVVVVDDLSSGATDNLDGVPARLMTGSILDSALLDEAFAGCSAVVHLAAVPSVPRSLLDPMASHDANATGTIQVLEAARRADTPYVIIASSSAVYGAAPDLPKRESMYPAPVSPYAATKLAGEAYARAYASSFGLDALVLRFFNVFGPHQPAGHPYAAVIPRFLDAALRGAPIQVHGDGKQTRDFIYIGSVVAVICEAVQRRVTSDLPVNLAFGTRTTLLELIGQIEELLGESLPVEHVAERPGDVRDSQADPTAFRKLFPGVQPVPLRDGLQATLEWFRTLES